MGNHPFASFRDALSGRPVAPAWWNAEKNRLLLRCLREGESHLAAGRPLQAVECWKEAIARLPDMPQPRRHALHTRIRDVLLTEARRACSAPVPDLVQAERCLSLLLRQSPQDRRVLEGMALIRHCAGSPSDALAFYDEALALGGQDPALVYASRLARLQAATGAEASQATPSLLDDPVPEDAAHQRLAALEALLLEGDPHAALNRFPNPDTPGLPRSWALEGAVIAALNERWVLSFQYMEAARREDWLPEAPLWTILYDAVLLQTAYGAGMDPSRTEDSHAVASLRDMARQRLRERAGHHDAGKKTAPSDDAFGGHYQQLAAWRCWDQLARAHGLASVGQWDEARSALNEAVDIHPVAPSLRPLRAWLACEAGDARSARALLTQLTADEREARNPNTLRLAVHVAERFEPAEAVIEHLNRLLDRYPGDAWGLERWKHWMERLGRSALERQHYRQALLHFASLLLRIPDDRDGWIWCARINERLGNHERARECFRQAARCQRHTSGRRHPGAPGEEQRALEPSHRLLGLLLEEAVLNSPPPPAFLLSEALLRKLAITSAHGPDLYLSALLRRWAAGP